MEMSSVNRRSASRVRNRFRRSPARGFNSAGAVSTENGFRIPSPRSMARTPAIHPRQLRCATNTVIREMMTPSTVKKMMMYLRVAALRRSLSDSGLVVDSIQVSVGGDGASRFSPQKDRSFYSEVYRSFEPRAASALEAVAPAVGLLAVAGAAAGAHRLSVLV